MEGEYHQVIAKPSFDLVMSNDVAMAPLTLQAAKTHEHDWKNRSPQKKEGQYLHVCCPVEVGAWSHCQNWLAFGGNIGAVRYATVFCSRAVPLFLNSDAIATFNM